MYSRSLCLIFPSLHFVVQPRLGVHTEENEQQDCEPEERGTAVGEEG